VEQHTATIALKLRDRAAAKHAIEELARERDGQKGPRLFGGLDIHFARVALLEEPGGVPYASWMILETNFDSEHADRDAAVREHLHRVATKRKAELAALLAATEGAGATSADAIHDLLLRKTAPSTAEYQGHTHRDLQRIELEGQVRREALAFAATLPRDTKAHDVHRLVREHIAKLQIRGLDLDARAPKRPDPAVRAQKLRETVRPWLTHAPLLFGSVLPVALSTFAELFAPQFDLQARAEERGPDAEALLRSCASTEDHGAHNALTHVVPLKPGWIRARALAGLHRYLAGVARDHFDEIGMLGGIPSIHFAKWVLIDEGRRLLFMSNYDGNWESYLGDFVDGAAAGLNAAWTCTEEYPNTIATFWGGANDEERFKAWARSKQRPTQLFYTAYPASSVATINNATWLRAGLHEAKLSGPALEEWRRRLT